MLLTNVQSLKLEIVVKTGDILADGPSTEQGELALGRNVLLPL